MLLEENLLFIKKKVLVGVCIFTGDTSYYTY